MNLKNYNMKFFKSNLFYVLVLGFVVMLIMAYAFDKGEILGKAMAK